MHEALTWVCALLVIILLVAGLLIRSQRKVIDQLAAEVAKFDGDGDGRIGGSRKRGF